MASSTTVLDGSVALPKLYVSINQDSVWVQIPGLISVTTADLTVSQIDTTNTDISNKIMTGTPGWQSPTTYEVVFNHTEAVWTQIKTTIGVGITVGWRLTWVDPEHSSTNPKEEWVGWIAGVPRETPIDNRWTIGVSIQVSGIVTPTEGT